MNTKIGKRLLAGVLSAVMLGAAVPVSLTTSSVSAEDSDGTTAVYATGFEDSDVSKFTGRGSVETIAASTDFAYSGTTSMCVSGRTKSWNGPQFLLDDLCEAGVEYTVSVAVRTEWHNDVKLSMEYTDTTGERHYSNLQSAVSADGSWAVFEDVKFSFDSSMTKVYLYLECNDTATMYVDDFEVSTAPVHQIQQDIVSLKDAYADYFKIGTAVTTSELAPQSTKDLIAKHFNSITLGNELKPDALLKQDEMIASGSNTDVVIDISGARTILDYCRDNSIPVRGHVLVWHSQTPDWFFKEGYQDDGDWVSKETMLQRMENYIKTVFETLEEAYPTVDFYAWDVVNEAWSDSGTPRNAGEQGDNGSNNSAWVQIFGDNSFIEPAFEYARKYAPEGTKLYYNDFNEYMDAKTTAIYNMAMELKDKGLIDGIGMQSHLDVSFPTATQYKKALAKFASTGLDIQITELDITTSDTTETGFEKQAQLYSDILDACVEYADSVSAVVFWGITDDKSWRASRCPLLFNEDYTAKPAFYAIVDGLDVPDVTTTSSATTSGAETETTVTETTSTGEILRGDITEDGKLNGFDAAAMRPLLLLAADDTWEWESDAAFQTADMNEDGAFNTADLVALTKFLLSR